MRHSSAAASVLPARPPPLRATVPATVPASDLAPNCFETAASTQSWACTCFNPLHADGPQSHQRHSLYQHQLYAITKILADVKGDLP